METSNSTQVLEECGSAVNHSFVKDPLTYIWWTLRKKGTSGCGKRGLHTGTDGVDWAVWIALCKKKKTKKNVETRVSSLYVKCEVGQLLTRSC